MLIARLLHIVLARANSASSRKIGWIVPMFSQLSSIPWWDRRKTIPRSRPASRRAPVRGASQRRAAGPEPRAAARRTRASEHGEHGEDPPFDAPANWGDDVKQEVDLIDASDGSLW